MKPPENEGNKKPEIHIKNKHTDDLIDHYWGSINYIFNLIKASEIKAGLILSFYGIILNVVYKSATDVLFTSSYSFVFYLILCLWIIATAISIFFSIRCFMPRIEIKFNKNIFFFSDVISKFGNIDEFSKLFYKISKDEDQLFDQLGQQVFINSKIAASKFKYVNLALRFLVLSMLLLLCLAVFLFLRNVPLHKV